VPISETDNVVATTKLEARYGFATLVWSTVILWASLTPDPPGRQFFDIPFGDKMVHFAGYALLCWLAAMSLRKAARHYRTGTLIAVPLTFSLVFGILNELIQTSIGGRSYESSDIIANTLGAVSVQAVFMYMQLRSKRNEVRVDGGG